MTTVRRLTVLLVWLFVVALPAPHTGASAAESVPSDPGSLATPSSTDGVSPLDFAGSFVYDAPVDAVLGRTVEPAYSVAPVVGPEGAGAPAALLSWHLDDSTRSLVAPRTGPLELANPTTVNNAGSPIRSFVTETDMTYYRVYSGDNTVGGYLTGAPPFSADDAVAGLALPPANRADFIQQVNVPAGTRLQSSIATEAFDQPGGLLQFELLDRIPTSAFGEGKPFR